MFRIGRLKNFIQEIAESPRIEKISLILPFFVIFIDIIILEHAIRIKEAYIFFAIFIFTYAAGAIAGIILGYEPMDSLFESVSATANVGLSVGITQAGMPTPLKLIYIFQMWAGRLEFISIFVSLGFILSLFRK